MDKNDIIRSLMWDYDISPQQVYLIINGEIDQVHHYNFETLMQKMIQNLPWYTILEIVPFERLKMVLTDSFIKSIRQPSLQREYMYVRNKLQTIIQPANRSFASN